ncbi:HD-GYP domain-containing protein (c-di-GMP phosphodiesterase class II) [Symbiobacterium terraclitae]|uniref:HD-GYP domain-containing protein (C-di-GMP phosphodiesterase class II) n=1 Tax=Symbiobacterium terraclitae TaxID=557451 RepID=A0ABS4JRM3_9FIRM|nr:HD-GYP domain-containing protein [Symbiobacterium terraclitae]MBP2018179.1 HD-GYP domain-containing protein (c-di-GMP phosphodiesterase class II) [Symbiobacterium terraclitae]
MPRVRRVPLSAVRPGDCLARDVLSEDGRVLLSRGVRITDAYLRLLQTHGVDAVYLPSGPASGRSHPEISQRVRTELTAELRKVTDYIRHTVPQGATGLQLPRLELQVKGLRNAVVQAVNEVAAHPGLAVPLAELRQADEYTLQHSVEVCVLATMLGNAMGLRGNELVNLAMSSLLHDVGKAGIPLAILNKPGQLTPEETDVMHRHTTLGWVMLRNQPELPEEAAIVALQHHERWTGGGYPLGLQGGQIHLYARICAVVDVYDALTADRVYRDGIDPGEALNMMTGPLRDTFDPEVLETFMRAMGRALEGAEIA